MKERLIELYEGETPRGVRFRYALLIFDITTILFLVGSSFTHHGLAVEIADAVIGLAIVADFTARLWISRNRLGELLHPAGVADLVVIASLLAPLAGEGLAFLRVARMLRLLRSYRLLSRLRQDFAFFRRNEQTIVAVTNLAVFVFVMTALVYETQHQTNDKIQNYVDALYFTVTTLTTTGFGDVTLNGSAGKLISVLIMIFGVSLFLRLVQVLFRPRKVEFECPGCGLNRHEQDAVHCKACGRLLHIVNEGED
ncbi:ion transporter [Gemmobacter lanyuensis]|uniref:Ion transporter n=1 Tax=Gemmobacter lanyuensis TaxID=1054497 RepID=A0A918MPE8_9RHOB|nr:potassium channel family protein [Gemmobacter lanyuensis]GGW44449.1 ion transporter [Gemmobacter lanyuensis]